MWRLPWRISKADHAMSINKNTVTLRRFCTHPAAALMALWGIGFVFMAIYGMSGGFTTWYLPVWEMELFPAIFVSAFLIVWYGFAFFWIWMALRPLQTVRLDGKEVMICFGSMVLRRMEYTEVKTVILTAEQGQLSRGRYHAAPRRLILSDKTMEELLEKAGRSCTSCKNPELYIRNYLRYRWKENGFFLEWTEEVEGILREQLTTSVFIM